MYMHIGSPEGVTLLEFEARKEEEQPETQQQEGQEGGELGRRNFQSAQIISPHPF
jgi:hypothetical protein